VKLVIALTQVKLVIALTIVVVVIVALFILFRFVEDLFRGV